MHHELSHSITSTPNHLMSITERPDIVFERGAGSWLYDSEGRTYLDWIQGWAVNCLGHCPPEIQQALVTQSASLINPSPAFFNRPALEFANKLAALSQLDEVFFASSGAEANEGAIKLARKWGQIHKGGAYEIITFRNGFHGRTLATMAASGKPGWDDLFAPAVPGFRKAIYNDLQSVLALIRPETVAIMLEPIQGEAGVIEAHDEFIKGLRTLCDTHRLMLILDEVQTGCARTGPFFAHQRHAIQPDIMTLGKGIGGGVPLSALLASKAASCFENGDQGGTYCGNPLMCAVGLSVIEALTDAEFSRRAADNATLLKSGLQDISQRHELGEVRGAGFLLAIEVVPGTAAAIVAKARRAGLIINAPRPDCLRIMPALNISQEEIESGLDRLDDVIAQV